MMSADLQFNAFVMVTDMSFVPLCLSRERLVNIKDAGGADEGSSTDTILLNGR